MKLVFNGLCNCSSFTEDGYEPGATGHSWLRWEDGDGVRVVFFRMEDSGMFIESSEKAAELESAVKAALENTDFGSVQ